MVFAGADHEAVEFVVFHEFLDHLAHFRVPITAIGVILVFWIKEVLRDYKGIQMPMSVVVFGISVDEVLNFIPVCNLLFFCEEI